MTIKLPDDTEIPNFEEQKLAHYYNGKYIGHLDNNQNIWLRTYIKENEIDGYSLEFNNKRIPIDNEGQIFHWPKGMYDTTEKLLKELIFKNTRL